MISLLYGAIFSSVNVAGMAFQKCYVVWPQVKLAREHLKIEKIVTSHLFFHVTRLARLLHSCCLGCHTTLTRWLQDFKQTEGFMVSTHLHTPK